MVTPPGMPPEQLAPVVAYGLARGGAVSPSAVVATLIDLAERGFYETRTEKSAREGRYELALGVGPRDERLVALEPHEDAVIVFFDRLLGGQVRTIGSLSKLIAPHDIAWRRRWFAMQQELQAAARRELRFRLGLSRLGAVNGETRGRREAWSAFASWTNRDLSHPEPPLTLGLEEWRRVLIYALVFGSARTLLQSGRIPPEIVAEASGATWWSYDGLIGPRGLWIADDAFSAHFVEPDRPGPGGPNGNWFGGPPGTIGLGPSRGF